MTDLIVNQSQIWEFVGGVLAINGLICFGLGSTYNMSFGKLGFGGHLVYLLVCLLMWCLIVGAKRIRVSEKVQGVVAALVFVVISLISVVHDQLVAGKSDALTIISYGSFALMSVSMSRKYELGFETGFSAFFLQLFAAQLFKINWILLPIALVFCSLIIILRHYPEESEVQEAVFITPNNGSHSPPNSVTIDIQRQDSPRQSLISTTNNQENNEAESSQAAMLHSTRIGQVSEGSIFEEANQQNHEQGETRSSFSNGNHREEELLRLYPPRVGQYSDESRSSTNNQQNNPEESYQAAPHAPSNNGEVSEESISDVVRDNLQNNYQEENRLPFVATHHSQMISEGSTIDGDNEQNNEQEEDSSSSLPAEYSYSPEQDPVSSGNYTLTIQNGWLYSSPPRQLLRRRRRWMTRGLQVMSSRVGDTLGQWRHHVAPASFFFFKAPNPAFT